MNIELFINISVLVSGVYLVSMALLAQTKNMISAIYFKVIPFFIGISCLFSAFKLFGWMQLLHKSHRILKLKNIIGVINYESRKFKYI